MKRSAHLVKRLCLLFESTVDPAGLRSRCDAGNRKTEGKKAKKKQAGAKIKEHGNILKTFRKLSVSVSEFGLKNDWNKSSQVSKTFRSVIKLQFIKIISDNR